MRCQWKQLLAILPPWIRDQLTEEHSGSLQELRLRLHAPPELVTGNGIFWLSGEVKEKDPEFIINTASRYSPWIASTISECFLTAPGGHRIGICGEAVIKNGRMEGIRKASSLCIRVARDYPGISRDLAEQPGSVLILGAPGWGKTTLLRDLIRCRSDTGEHIAVVDERCELFPPDFSSGKHTDILSGCPKELGITSLLRVMGPSCIAVDEITAPEDCRALIRASRCGVNLLATAHASSMEDFLSREVYRPLAEQRIFHTYVILCRDKSWHTERSKGWITNGSVRY